MPTILKKVYATEAEVPETVKGFYKESADKKNWILDDVSVEGTIPAVKLDEFRQNNTKLTERLKSYGDSEFGGGEFTPERIPELLQIEKDVHDGKLTKAEEIKRRVDERTKEVSDGYATKEKKWTEKFNTLQGRLTTAMIDSAALAAAARFGLKKGAEQTFLPFVRTVFTIDAETGEPVAYEGDGKTVKIDRQGDPMRGKTAIEKFVADCANGDHKYYFVDNQGQGADGSGGGGGGDGRAGTSEVNPWAKETWSRTNQTLMVKKDFAKAKAMAAKHGFDLKPSAMRTVPA